MMSWADLLTWSDGHGLLAKRLYVVLSEPANGLGRSWAEPRTNCVSGQTQPPRRDRQSSGCGARASDHGTSR
jgi:hypothetical protein